jgi:glycosyltransferase involved in cell wall biosynthesis
MQKSQTARPTGLKIRYLVPTMGLGGAERHVLGLAEGLNRRGFDCGIVCVYEEGMLGGEIRTRGIPLESLKAANRKWNAETLYRIARWLSSARVDILHTYLFGLDSFGILPAKLFKVPVAISSRREIAVWQRRKHLWMNRLGNFFADGVICCSRAVEKWTVEKENINPRKIRTLYNGVDLGRFCGADHSADSVREEFCVPKDGILIGTVANFSEVKGYPYLLDAARRILCKNPFVWFLLVGGGPLIEETKRMAREIPGHERIVFSGFRTDIPRLIGAMDIFVFASVLEGFPNVLLEAMAMGKPVVATETGGIPELISSGDEGILVPPGNGERLAEGVLSVLENPALGKRFAEKARGKIDSHFSIERMVDQYEQFYLSLFRKAKN